MMQYIVPFIAWLTFFPLFGICYWNRCYGKQHLLKQGALIASNHTSFLDPPLIGFCLYPRRLCYLARDTLFGPILGWILKQIGCFPIKRGKGNAAIFKIIPDLTAKNKIVVIFPEGTRSKDGKLQPAQMGIGLLIQRAQVPVIPCYVHGTFSAWGPHRRFPKLWGKTAVIFGSALDFSYLQDADKKTAQREMALQIMDAIAKLKQWYLDGAKGTPP